MLRARTEGVDENGPAKTPKAGLRTRDYGSRVGSQSEYVRGGAGLGESSPVTSDGDVPEARELGFPPVIGSHIKNMLSPPL